MYIFEGRVPTVGARQQDRASDPRDQEMSHSLPCSAVSSP